MLVIRRKRGERVIINQNIHIVILESSHHHVKLGIQAPITIPVHRAEIQQLINRELQGKEENKEDFPEHIKRIYERMQQYEKELEEYFKGKE